MLNSIKAFFEERIARRADDSAQSAEHKARVAAAALLVEVVKADTDIGADEKAAVLAAAQRKFGLEPEEAEGLIRLAEEESREAVDFYQFTSAINQAFSPEQKQRLVECLRGQGPRRSISSRRRPRTWRPFFPVLESIRSS